jgi:DNA-binding Lrp family transcriptional regulator
VLSQLTRFSEGIDAIITVEVRDLAELSQLIYKVIEKIPNVVRTETCIVLFSGDSM